MHVACASEHHRRRRTVRILRAVTAALLLVLGLGRPAAAELPDGPETVPVGQWPLRPQPQVVRGFDPPDDPWGEGHRGVDLAASIGQPVFPALPGTVTFAGVIAGRGVVTVGHGSTRTTYEPVAASVQAGDVVGVDSVLGAVQGVGSHCLPQACLHWGWLEQKVYLDPLLLVGAAGPVRLLPLGDPDTATRSPPGPRDAVVASGGIDPSARERWARSALLVARWVEETLRRGGAPVGTPPAVGPW